MPLMVRMHCERPHPRLGARKVRDIECNDPVLFVAPDHCACSRVCDREPPHRRIQMRDAHAGHSIATVPVGERLAEDVVERRDVGDPYLLRTGRRSRLAPCAGNGHYAAPAVSKSTTSCGESDIALPPPALCSTIDCARDGSYRTAMT